MRGRRHPTDATPSGDEGKRLAWALAFGIRLAVLRLCAEASDNRKRPAAGVPPPAMEAYAAR